MTNLTIVGSNQVVPLLRELAQKLGTTTAHLWQVLLYQAHIQAISDIILMSGGIFICAGLWWLACSLKKKHGGDADEVIVAFVVATILSVITAIMVASLFQTVLTTLFNPSYWALQTILGYLP